MDLKSSRLAIATILQMEAGAVVVLAPVCSSFSDMCLAQSKRAWYRLLGDTSRPFVALGNVLAHRWG